MVLLFFLIALFAPFLAQRLPLVWHDKSGVTTYPLLRDFFAPAETTEPTLETGINFVLVFLPAAVLAWSFLGLIPIMRKARSWVVSMLLGALLAAGVWWSVGDMIWRVGGADWFYSERSPYPDQDDLDKPNMLAQGHAGESKLADDIRSRWRELNPDGLIGGQPTSTSWSDAQKRRLAETLVVLVDSGKIGSDARSSRLALEDAFPGMIKPMRMFRSAFLLMVAASFIAVSGLTFILMAGAAQFSVSPRWLVLLLLGVLLYLPFTAKPVNDPLPYREMAQRGEGSGIFPLIPYGPNEQGFGAKLPPYWWAPSAEFTPNDIRNPVKLAELIDNPSTPAQGRIAILLEKPPASGYDAASAAAVLNTLLDARGLYSPDSFPGVENESKLKPYVRALNSPEGLTGIELRRANRLLIDRAYPGLVAAAPAGKWKAPGQSAGKHLFGTDESGRDVLVRLIHGARVSLSVGFVSVALATLIGLVVGSLAAYYGGWIDMAISRFVEIMMCFPSFFLILAVIAVLDKRSILNIMLVIGFTSWTGVARLVRGDMLRQKKMDYVSASIALGASDIRTIFRHILPNSMASVLVYISFGITGAILTEAGLSFIGFGVTPPTPTWGQLLNEARVSPLLNWWLAVFPGLVLFLGVFSYNIVGESIRDALDPRLSRR